jgi:hydrogenase maturation protein HypF
VTANCSDNDSRASVNPADAIVRQRLSVRGRVQGVGFRPFVYRLARELSLVGSVCNDMQGATIEIEGDPRTLEQFRSRLELELPAIASIVSIAIEDLDPIGEPEFVIATSDPAGRQEAHISPDAATCEDCLRELRDPSDRRYGYPFINCTNCGPRYSIIQSVPYDRPGTTMASFTMCPECQREYDDPSDRRFHAQPNACPVCGPKVWLVEASGDAMGGDAIERARALLKDRAIVAIKGLGGFHLACRADSDDAVGRLRAGKARLTKPFAVMVASLDVARELVAIDERTAELLTSIARPIVLAPAHPDARVGEHVAPGVDSLGVMLPYTPLHHLLFDDELAALVMTSGNPSSEPLCCDNVEAIERLGEIADAFLLHDRDIERRVDDSVISAMGDTPMPIRRARGYAPSPIKVPLPTPEPILAVGAGLKSTICLLAGDEAVLSEHLGDLDNPVAYRQFVKTVEAFKELFAHDPMHLACDSLGYGSTDYAFKRARKPHGGRQPSPEVHVVQHHHAHIVSCMADNGINGEVLGIACDGVGQGRDGHVWGGELFRCDESDCTRLGHLRYIPHVGGDAMSRQTWRSAAAWVWDAFEEGSAIMHEAVFGADRDALDIMARRFVSQSRPLYTSSTGRLFDAAANLLGVCDHNHHEAQAPMQLESLARSAPSANPLDYDLIERDNHNQVVMDPRAMIRQLVDARRDGEPVSTLARAFHVTLAAMLADAAEHLAEREKLQRVVLSGGCFANGLFTTELTDRLARAGLEVYTHRQVPTTDGGIALGQAVVAAARLRRG